MRWFLFVMLVAMSGSFFWDWLLFDNSWVADVVVGVIGGLIAWAVGRWWVARVRKGQEVR